ncbi:MAG: tRNA (adenosine(37)-N6)-threonylcarbamoyltransferase complex dimerization subunit type 1 TsaB [Desulfosarcina sp.]|nr:tRNA (adenosine(37)-N6)-threonylcarbamoyltransferase complex dimerization subunit type 1 TsaB [Desulfobacterales bacterium]
MNILAIDTASRTCSVAVCRDDVVLAEITDGSGKTHSRHLMAMVGRALDMSVGNLKGIDALAVNRGPGSFTGVRIGISTAKGLAAASDKPLVGVSGLAALAWQNAPTERLICPMLDARRQEVYWACYAFSDGDLVTVAPETVGAPEEAVRDLERPCVLIGDGALAYRSRLQDTIGEGFRLAPPFQHLIRAGAIAFVARPRLEKWENDCQTLAPLYIRPSYAKEPVDKSGQNR